MLDETFGAENFCSLITVSKTAGQTAELLGGVCDYVLWYAKGRCSVKFRRVLVNKALEQDFAVSIDGSKSLMVSAKTYPNRSK